MSFVQDMLASSDATALIVEAHELAQVLATVKGANSHLRVLDYRNTRFTPEALEAKRPTVVLLGEEQDGLQVALERRQAVEPDYGRDLLFLVPRGYPMPSQLRWAYAAAVVEA